MSISDKLLKEIAEHIILGRTKDIDYASVWEITEDRLSNEDEVLSIYEMEEFVVKVDNLISSAKVTVEFGDA